MRESVGKSGRIDPDSVESMALLNDRICVKDVESADGAASLRSLRTSCKHKYSNVKSTGQPCQENLAHNVRKIEENLGKKFGENLQLKENHRKC